MSEKRKLSKTEVRELCPGDIVWLEGVRLVVVLTESRIDGGNLIRLKLVTSDGDRWSVVLHRNKAIKTFAFSEKREVVKAFRGSDTWSKMYDALQNGPNRVPCHSCKRPVKAEYCACPGCMTVFCDVDMEAHSCFDVVQALEESK